MPGIPRRESLKALTDAADAIARTSALGFARALPSGKVSVLYSYAFGLGEWVLPVDELPAALDPSTDGVVSAGRDALEAERARAVEIFLLDNGTGHLVSVKLPDSEPAARLWIGLTDPQPPSADQLRRIEELIPLAAACLDEPLSQEATLPRLVRLERAAELIPALLDVLDVRDVMDRLSATAKRALPHDLLILTLFSEDFSTATVYARSEKGLEPGMVIPNRYPPATIRAWTFSIVDDQLEHPNERAAPSTKLGVRSSLRIAIRFDDRVDAGVAFMSFAPRAYSDADVPIGLRLSEHVASAISHFRMAQRLAEQARRTEELQARTTNLELLDEMLGALIDSGDLREVFDRVSTLAMKVLPHDGAALMVQLPDRRRARLYASSGFPPGAIPEVMEIPAELLDPAWEYDIDDDLSTAGGYAAVGVRLGFQSRLRVPIRLEGLFVGGLMFASRAPAAFKQRDILVARRIADRLAVTLARDREVAASRRADEAAERAARLEARVESLTQELDERTGYRRVIGESASWKHVLTQATQVAATETTALLLGESGTGKEVVARFIHRGSQRRRGPFVALNCAALPEQLLEAELFGYERGAFTGAAQSKPGQLEQAAGGTLFLDEVGEMSLPAQAKFLRVLQEREFQRLGGTRVLRTDARIVAATNRDLSKAIANAQFREDLFYRLNVFAIRLPPLRDRRDDILPLTEAFLKEFSRAFTHAPGGITRDAKQRLMAYHWPGNIRELRNVLERAAILCDGGLITDDHLALQAPSAAVPRHASEPVAAMAAPAPHDTAGLDLSAIEKATIEQALQNARFNKSRAAKALGLTRHQLYIRMRRHDIAE